MADLESPEAFAERVSRELEDGLPPPKVCIDAVVEMARARDAAVRREARRAALLEAGTVCADEAADWGRLAGHTAEQMEGRYAAEAARLAVKLRALAGGSDD